MVNNLFSDLPPDLPEEMIDVIAKSSHVRIERIVSTGHSSPDGFWYDQSEHEWVVVLRGEAMVMFEEESSPRHLQAGDYLLIPAHHKHRVEWTTLEEPTVWLAMFFAE